jgi:2-oxoisovalerate dehydrogenase E1 component
MTPEQLDTIIDSAMMTFCLHVEARIASLVGQGFYTIGPCGEELMASVGLSLRDTDASALHYRHVATQLTRQLGGGKTLDQVALDRARGFVCSALDPVTGGKHCCIGGGSHDFLVTSTLASQAPPAVGRALGIPLAHQLGIPTMFPKDAVSYVSVGDGSVNKAHFLAATNLAEYAHHRGLKCPVVFGISNNDMCISLRGYSWLSSFVERYNMKVFQADGYDAVGIFEQTEQAVSHARKLSRPTMLVVNNLPRRFGHAATDRQAAYLDQSEIQAVENANPLGALCATAVQSGLHTSASLTDRFSTIQACVAKAFDAAVEEPKISDREALLKTNSRPEIPFDKPPRAGRWPRPVAFPDKLVDHKGDKEKNEVMRKHMTRAFDEVLATNGDTVYIGEDVMHGGYYLVTDKLATKWPMRVRDFPPDETTLVGAAVGYAQAGMVPILEIPYAKYLDCGGDMFFEAVISNWLSNGNQANGMVIRLQGFDKGVFGGNFHTHNELHIPAGLDVVAYSNGEDYVKGLRYAMHQARAGRIVMLVDSTNLLNQRHLDITARDNAWLRKYPEDGVALPWSDISIHPAGKEDKRRKAVAIVSYGNGVPTSLLARAHLEEEHGMSNICVVDCPYLSSPPKKLVKLLSSGDIGHVVFADVCKDGPGMPFAAFITQLQNKKALPASWRCVGAVRTYNPLGRTLTFTSEEDITAAVIDCVGADTAGK